MGDAEKGTGRRFTPKDGWRSYSAAQPIDFKKWGFVIAILTVGITIGLVPKVSDLVTQKELRASERINQIEHKSMSRAIEEMANAVKSMAQNVDRKHDSLLEENKELRRELKAEIRNALRRSR